MEKRNFITLAILAMITTIYSSIENGYFNSFLKIVNNTSDFKINIMVSFSSIFGAIFFILWGAISDNIRSKYGRRKPILLIGLLSSAFFFYLFSATNTYIGFLIIDGIVLAFTGNMMWASRHSLIPDLTEITNRGKTNSNLFIFGAIGGGLMVVMELVLPKEDDFLTFESHLILIWIGIIGMIISSIFIFFFLKEPPIESLPPKRSWKQDIKNIFNFEEFKKHKELYKLLLALIFFGSARNAYVPLLLNFRQTMGFMSDTEIILYDIAMGFGMFLGSFILTRISDKYGRKRIILTVIPISLIGLFLDALSGFGFVYFILGMAITYFSFEGIARLQEVWSQDIVDEDARGKFLGILNISSSAGGFLVHY
jgi:Na+/melibiose symporter-like transporter